MSSHFLSVSVWAFEMMSIMMIIIDQESLLNFTHDTCFTYGT